MKFPNQDKYVAEYGHVEYKGCIGSKHIWTMRYPGVAFFLADGVENCTWWHNRVLHDKLKTYNYMTEELYQKTWGTKKTEEENMDTPIDDIMDVPYLLWRGTYNGHRFFIYDSLSADAAEDYFNNHNGPNCLCWWGERAYEFKDIDPASGKADIILSHDAFEKLVRHHHLYDGKSRNWSWAHYSPSSAYKSKHEFDGKVIYVAYDIHESAKLLRRHIGGPVRTWVLSHDNSVNQRSMVMSSGEKHHVMTQEAYDGIFKLDPSRVIEACSEGVRYMGERLNKHIFVCPDAIYGNFTKARIYLDKIDVTGAWWDPASRASEIMFRESSKTVHFMAQKTYDEIFGVEGVNHSIFPDPEGFVRANDTATVAPRYVGHVEDAHLFVTRNAWEANAWTRTFVGSENTRWHVKGTGSTIKPGFNFMQEDCFEEHRRLGKLDGLVGRQVVDPAVIVREPSEPKLTLLMGFGKGDPK